METFATIASVASNAAFRGRLAVAVTEQCRYDIERPAHSGEGSAHLAWAKANARDWLAKTASAVDMERFARFMLLPPEWGSFAPLAADLAADAVLQARVAERIVMLASTPEPALDAVLP